MNTEKLSKLQVYNTAIAQAKLRDKQFETDPTKEPPKLLAEILERERQQMAERAKEIKIAREAKTWACFFCGMVHEPEVIEAPNGKFIVIPVKACTCPQAQLEQQRQAQEEARQVQAKRIAELETTELWCQFNTEWPGEEDACELLRQAKRRAKEWYAEGNSGLLLTGGYGCGKSHLLRAVATALAMTGAPAAFYTEPELLANLTTKTAEAEGRAQVALNRCRLTKVLILDDIGSQNFSGAAQWARDLLQSFYFRCLDRRAGGDFVTLISTNVEFFDLEPVMGERAYDRLWAILKNRNNIISLWGVSSYRRKGF